MKQPHIAFAAFTPAFYRWEIQRTLSVFHAGETYMEPDVGQVEDKLLAPGAVVADIVWGLYGRHLDGEVEHIADFATRDDAVDLVTKLGCSATCVLPGPRMICYDRAVVFENDGAPWQESPWKMNAANMVLGIGRNLSDVITVYAAAWARLLSPSEMPYKSQYLLEKLIDLMKKAV